MKVSECATMNQAGKSVQTDGAVSQLLARIAWKGHICNMNKRFLINTYLYVKLIIHNDIAVRWTRFAFNWFYYPHPPCLFLVYTLEYLRGATHAVFIVKNMFLFYQICVNNITFQQYIYHKYLFLFCFLHVYSCCVPYQLFFY